MADQYKNTIQTWRKLAAVYHEKFKGVRIYDESYEAFVSYLNSESPAILEVGCGPGTVTKWLKDHLPEANILATDVAPEMIEEAKKHVDGVLFEAIDAREINRFKKEFDAIIAGFCIPYLKMDDLDKFIASSAKLLRTNGVLYMSCIEKDHSHSFTQTGGSGHTMTVHYHNENDVLMFLEQHHLEHLESIRVNYPLPSRENDTHLIVIGRK